MPKSIRRCCSIQTVCLHDSPMIIHATTDYAMPVRSDYDRARNKVCGMPRCDTLIQDRSTYCKPCTQKMRRKIEGQVARLLALAKTKREAQGK